MLNSRSSWKIFYQNFGSGSRTHPGSGPKSYCCSKKKNLHEGMIFLINQRFWMFRLFPQLTSQLYLGKILFLNKSIIGGDHW